LTTREASTATGHTRISRSLRHRVGPGREAGGGERGAAGDLRAGEILGEWYQELARAECMCGEVLYATCVVCCVSCIGCWGRRCVLMIHIMIQAAPRLGRITQPCSPAHTPVQMQTCTRRAASGFSRQQHCEIAGLWRASGAAGTAAAGGACIEHSAVFVRAGMRCLPGSAGSESAASGAAACSRRSGTPMTCTTRIPCMLRENMLQDKVFWLVQGVAAGAGNRVR